MCVFVRVAVCGGVGWHVCVSVCVVGERRMGALLARRCAIRVGRRTTTTPWRTPGAQDEQTREQHMRVCVCVRERERVAGVAMAAAAALARWLPLFLSALPLPPYGGLSLSDAASDDDASLLHHHQQQLHAAAAGGGGEARDDALIDAVAAARLARTSHA